MENVKSPLNASIGLQVVGADCDISNYEPTFSECLDFFEGDPFEDTRQSKKQKVCRHLSTIYASTSTLLQRYQTHTHVRTTGLLTWSALLLVAQHNACLPGRPYISSYTITFQSTSQLCQAAMIR